MERFGQVDAYVSRKNEGTGLGLPLAKQLVEIHDGLFSIRSQPGAGTVVTITFPRERTIAREQMETWEQAATG
jgi:signal transduction histidine kinase